MDANELLKYCVGVDEKLAAIIIKYIDKYVAMSTNKEQVKRNLISQIRMNFSGFAFADLNGISGCVNSLGNVINIDSNLDDWLLENTIFHELTHQIARNEIRENEGDRLEFVQFNLGLKVSVDDNMEHSAMMRLKQWEVDGNNYVYNKGNNTLDEWITEWIANKLSDLNNVELKRDNEGYFRKKTSHGYDGSNIMNMMELVYGSENVANIITGLELSEEERRCIIPMKEIHKINEMIDSNQVLNPEEVEIFKHLEPPYLGTPNITGLIIYYISEYQKQDEPVGRNKYLQKMIDVLIRAYSIKFEDRIINCNNLEELNTLFNELSKIQNSIIWNEDLEKLQALESYRIFDDMRNMFITKANSLNSNINDYSSLFLSASQLLEQFKLEEKNIKEMHSDSKGMSQKL